MFTNMGGKIKTLAIVLCFLGMMASVFLGVFLISLSEDMLITGIAIIAGGVLSAWLSSFLLYGFGEIIDQLTEINQNTDRLAQIIISFRAPRQHGWEYPNCRSSNSASAHFCINCGTNRY